MNGIQQNASIADYDDYECRFFGPPDITRWQAIRIVLWTVFVSAGIGALIYASIANAQSQSFACSAKAEVAEAMVRDFKTTDFKPEFYLNKSQRDIANLAKRCEDAKDVKACYVRLCMEENT